MLTLQSDIKINYIYRYMVYIYMYYIVCVSYYLSSFLHDFFKTTWKALRTFKCSDCVVRILECLCQIHPDIEETGNIPAWAICDSSNFVHLYHFQLQSASNLCNYYSNNYFQYLELSIWTLESFWNESFWSDRQTETKKRIKKLHDDKDLRIKNQTDGTNSFRSQTSLIMDLHLIKWENQNQ